MWQRRHIRGPEAISGLYAQRECVWVFNVDARLTQLVHESGNVLWIAVDNLQAPSSHCGGNCESSGLDPIGYDRMFGASQVLHSLDANRARARTLDARTHFVQELGQID